VKEGPARWEGGGQNRRDGGERGGDDDEVRHHNSGSKSGVRNRKRGTTIRVEEKKTKNAFKGNQTMPMIGGDEKERIEGS